MLEQMFKNCSPWEGPTLENPVGDCIPWQGPHAGTEENCEDFGLFNTWKLKMWLFEHTMKYNPKTCIMYVNTHRNTSHVLMPPT